MSGEITANATSLAGVNSPSFEGDPFVTADGQWLYFVRSGDIYRAGVSGSDFVDPMPALDLNTADGDTRASLTPDDLTVFLASSRPGAGHAGSNVWMATRTSAAQPFSGITAMPLLNVNTDQNEFDPHPSSDALRLYLAPWSQALQRQHLVVASRASVAEDFGAPVPIAELNASDSEADPAPSGDERVIVFSTTRSGSPEIWYATRATRDDPFSTPLPVPGLNDAAAYQGDPYLSADACALYFASDRVTGDRDLWVATFDP